MTATRTLEEMSAFYEAAAAAFYEAEAVRLSAVVTEQRGIIEEQAALLRHLRTCAEQAQRGAVRLADALGAVDWPRVNTFDQRLVAKDTMTEAVSLVHDIRVQLATGLQNPPVGE